MLKFSVEGIFHQFTEEASPEQYGARVKENEDAVQDSIQAMWWL